MFEQKIIIKQENLFIAYLYEMLDNGVTEGVTEEEFTDFISKLQNMLDTQKTSMNFVIEPDSFECIVHKANKCHSEEKTCIYLQSKDNKLIAKPTYHLKRLEHRQYGTDLFPRHYDLLRNIVEEKHTPFKYDIDMLECFSQKLVEIAQKVAAIYVNDSITRYVRSKIEKGRWPVQCADIDEYIFKRDIARIIDEEGTRKILKELYIHAISAVCEVMKTRLNDELIEFSNDKHHLLAYANFKKLYIPKPFEFLGKYIYNEYETKNERINVSISVESVSFSSLSCTYSDPYGEWSDEYVRKQGIIGDEPVEIMKKRIGII